jgi:hypothetical protein
VNNFDPCPFIECAMACSFEDWNFGGGSGREQTTVPRIVEVSWDDFRAFLLNGQEYE